MQAIPKIFDKESNQWIELLAKPVAEEVVKIMKEDYLYNKKTMDYWLLENLDVPTTPIRVAVFTDGNELDDYTKSAFEFAFNDYINTLSNRKLFNLDKFLESRSDTATPKPPQFKVDATVTYINEGEDNTVISLPKHDNITNDIDICEMLAKTSTGTLEAKYIYNDHPIEDKKLFFESK